MTKPAPAYIERRSEARTPANAPGRVLHGQGLSLWADCVIRDLSRSGAKIELSHFYRLPPRFVLVRLQDGLAHDVVLKWRRGDLAGMAFEATHALAETTEARLAPARQAWLALAPGFTPANPTK